MVSFSRENLHIHLPSKARLRTYSLLIPNPSYFLPLHTFDQLTRCIFFPFPQDLPIECVISMIFPCNFSRLCSTWSPSKPAFPKATWDWNKRPTNFYFITSLNKNTRHDFQQDSHNKVKNPLWSHCQIVASFFQVFFLIGCLNISKGGEFNARFPLTHVLWFYSFPSLFLCVGTLSL